VQPELPKKIIPPAKKGSKNERGDYVVTTIDIPDMRTGMKVIENKLEDSDSDSEEGYGDEDEPVKEETKVEEAPKCKYNLKLFNDIEIMFWSVICIFHIIYIYFVHRSSKETIKERIKSFR